MQIDLFPMPEIPVITPAKSLAGVTLIHGDSLVEMTNIASGSVDMICTDLPFGATNCHWDSVIPFEPLWAQYKRIIKGNGAIVLFGSQPFTSALVMSQPKWFRYEWIWEKSSPSNFLDANKKALKSHENILIFYAKLPTYNPQKWQIGERFMDRRKTFNTPRNINTTYGTHTKEPRTREDGTRYPLSVIPIESHWGQNQHPTQKPTALLEYLIRTYTNEGDTVLDSCMGSGTTGSACINTNRKFIGIEKDDKYFEIAVKRINNQLTP